MTWKPPETEAGWQECLSAYLDDELGAEEARTLEVWLASDARRAEQLEALRGLSRVLREWSLEAPAPDPAHLRELRQALAERGPRRAWAWAAWPDFSGWRPRWAFQTAIFLLGVLVGVAGPRMIARPGALSAPAGRAVASAAPAPREELGLAISPRQSEQLAREVRAGGLRDAVMQGLDKQDWQTAREALDKLRQQYPDSQALRELKKDPSLRRLENQWAMAERI